MVPPIDVDQTGCLHGGDDLGGVVQDDVEVDAVAEPVGDGAYLGAGVQGEHEPAVRVQGRTSEAIAAGSSDAARWMSEYHSSTAPHPSWLVGRISWRRSPTW